MGATFLGDRRKLFLIAAILIIVAALLVPTLANGASSIDARDYGVAADNTTDDTAALLRACQAGAQQGVPVQLPSGRIRLGSTLTIPAGVTLLGRGGKGDARTDASFDGTWLRGAIRFNSNVTVKDMKIGDKVARLVAEPAKYDGVRNVRFENVRFRGGGGGWNGAIFAVNGGNIAGLYIDGCEFERNMGSWTSNGGAGAVFLACDTGYGNVLRDIWITNSHFGVSNGVAKGQPTFNLVFWQSEEGGTGWWGDVHIIDNVFETTDEFNLDFDGLWARDNGHNDVEIRGNLIKGAGIVRPDGSRPSWGYAICTEPTREGTVIEGNTIYKGFLSAFKTTKNTTDTVFRNNVIDLTIPNGVVPYYPDYYRTINLFDGARNRVAGNTIYVPASVRASSQVIYRAESTSTVSSNAVKTKSGTEPAPAPAVTPTPVTTLTVRPAPTPTPTATLTVRPAPTSTPRVSPTPTPVPTSGEWGTLLSWREPAWASSALWSHSAAKANDGDVGTRWMARTTAYPQSWTVDLGGVARVSRVKVVWSSGRTRRTYAYKVRTSLDGRRFATALDRSGNRTAGPTADPLTVRARYVRIIALGVAPEGRAASIAEVKVFGRR